MKKLLTVLIIGISAQYTFAQNVADAVRYSTQNITGTARFRGTGGAFGALGGDVSAINVNPAGSAIFNRSFVSLSLSSDTFDNQTYYNDGITETKDPDLHFNLQKPAKGLKPGKTLEDADEQTNFAASEFKRLELGLGIVNFTPFYDHATSSNETADYITMVYGSIPAFADGWTKWEKPERAAKVMESRS